MFCTNCGKDNPQNSNFCAHCGKALRTVPPPFDKQRLKEEKEREKLEIKTEKEARLEQEQREKSAAELNKELRDLISVPIDYRNLIAPEIDLWHFSTADGRQFIKRAEGSAGVISVGTVIEGAIACTHVLKGCGGTFIKRAFFPFILSPEYINKFNAKKFYKQKIGWNEATEHLNSDPSLKHMLKGIQTLRESGSGRSYMYIPDENKHPLTAIGQLVPQGDLTLAALLFIGPAKGEVAKCINALGRIRALIGTLAKPGSNCGPALGWGILHDLRGDMESVPGLHARLREGWSLLVRAHAIEAQVDEVRRR